MRPHICQGCARMILMYEDGHDSYEIGAATNNSQTTVLKYLRLHGVTIRPKGNNPNRRGARALRDDVLARYRAGESAAAIARAINRTRERVRQIVIAADGTYRPPRRKHHCSPVCATLLAARDASPSGHVTLTRLAQETGIGYERFTRAARHHAIETGLRHQCTRRCTEILAALTAGVSPTTACKTPAGAARWRSYHPDWPWFDGRRRPVRA